MFGIRVRIEVNYDRGGWVIVVNGLKYSDVHMLEG